MVSCSYPVQATRVIKSSVVPVSSGEITLDLDENAINYTHNFVGIAFFSNSSGTVSATPDSGTVSLSTKLSTNPAGFELADAGTFPASNPQTASFAGAPVQVKAVFNAVTGADYAQLILNQSDT